ncbi:DUF3566 domain-containing protein [Catenulispora yoronensis]
MGTVAYQQPDSAQGQAGPRPQTVGGGWSARPSGPGAAPSGAPRYQQAPGAAPRGRKARLRVAKVDPWSVMKTTFVLSIAFAVVSVVAAALLWSALNALGVFDSINRTLASVAPSNQPNSLTLTSVLSFGKVISFTALVSVVNIVLFTALATLGAYLYNMCSALVGGVEVTLADDTAS